MTAVTIIMAVRNAASFLPDARRMVEAQTLQDYEVVVIDDASDDGSQELLRAWEADDARVRLLVAAERQGVAAGRNQAVAAATSDYLWFVDCDDTWAPVILERLVGAANEADADLVISRARAHRPDGSHEHWIGGSLDQPVPDKAAAVRLLLRGTVQGHLWCKLFRRRLFDDIRFPLTRSLSDLATMGDLLTAADTVTVIDESFYWYVVRPGSILNTRVGRARDVLDCRNRVAAAVHRLPDAADLADDLLRFDFRECYLSSLHDAVRREPDDEDAKAVKAEVRSRLTAKAIGRLFRIGAFELAVPALFLRVAPGPYAWAYRRFRMRKWGSVGYFADGGS